jgi:DNA (cytosine-5)-methyltransferase 1
VKAPIGYTLDDVRARSSSPLFTVVSTFAGGGGSSTGYRLAGGKVIFINEVVDEAVTTYRANYPDTPIEHADIRRFNHGKDDVEALFGKYGIKKGDLDILDGSPPCSPFSSAAGKRKPKDDPNAFVSYSDIEQKRIDMLIHDFVFMANVMQPRVCVFENVPEILRADQYRIATDRLRAHKYLVAGKVLSASDYGAPQERERLITIAVREDIASAAKIHDEGHLIEAFPIATVERAITVREALHELKQDDAQRQMLLTFARRGAEYELMRLLPHSPPKPWHIRDTDPTYTSNFLLNRASWDHPSKTITATGASGRGGVLHPDEDRVFTIPELRRISGLPDDFKLTGTFDQKAERIGRMVPPPLTMAVAWFVYDRILAPRWSN